MSGFSKKEIAAELKRRADAIRQDSTVDESDYRGDANCLHCGSPLTILDGTDPDSPFCSNCLD